MSLLICLCLSCAFLCACGAKADPVVLTPQSELVGQTLSEYMDYEKEQGRLNYTVDCSGFITSINGVKNTTNTFWILYTDDAENSDTSWGNIEYEGKPYASATLGAAELVIAENCTYIWVYTKF